MKAILIVLIALVFAVSLSANNVYASTDLPVGHWVYEALEDLAILGMTDIIGLNTRPMPRMAAAHKVAEMIEKVQNEKLHFSFLRDERIMDKAEALLYKLMDEFEDELIRLGIEVALKGDKPPKPVLYKFFDQAQKKLVYSSFSDSNTKVIQLENQRGWDLQEEFNARLSLQSWACFADVLGLMLEPAFYASKEKNKLTLDEGFLSASYKNISSGIGRATLWWGSGRHGSLLLSSNARPLYLASIGSTTPFRLPYFEKLGLWGIRFFTAKLIGEKERAIKEPWLSGLKIDFSPHKRLNFSAGHTVMWGGEGAQHVSTADFFEMFLTKLGGGANEPENHLISFAGEWVVPGLNSVIPLANGAVLYSEIGAEDEANGLPKNLGGLGGLKFIDLFTIEDLDFVVEYARTDSNWYTHYAYTSGYTSRGFILGHHVGTDGDDFFVNLRKKLSEQLEINLMFDAERHGLSRSVPEKEYEGGINFRMQYLENLILEVGYKLEYFDDFRNAANHTAENHIGYVGARVSF